MALEDNERPIPSILKFESMLKTDDVYFFDAEDFEEIIHHYLNNGKISLAKKGIQIGLRQHPHSMALKLLEVEVMVFENKLDQAEFLLDNLQELDPANEEIYIQRASILSKKDNHQGAIEMLVKALHFSPDNFDVFSLLGMEYLFLDDYKLARENFIQCVAIDPEDYASLYNVVYCFEFLEDFEGAINYLNDYLEKNPYCEVAWHQLGKMYTAIDMYAEALTAFDFAIISDDTFIGAYYEKGRVLEKLSRYQEAIDNYNITIEMEDPTSHAFLRMGKCHEKLGNDEFAKKFYYKTVHEDPLLDKGWLAITHFYLRKKNYDKAVYYINKAISIDGENAQYWKRSGEIYKAMKNYDEADFSFKQTVELGNYEKSTWLDWSKVLVELNDLNAASQVLLQGIEFYPENTQFQYTLSGIFLKLGQNQEAQKLLVSAYKNDKKKFKAFYKKHERLITEDLIKAITQST